MKLKRRNKARETAQAVSLAFSKKYPPTSAKKQVDTACLFVIQSIGPYQFISWKKYLEG